jgi:phage protein D
LAKRYDAVAKPAGGRLIFAKRGESKSVTGIELPRIVLTPADVGQWAMSINTKKSAGTSIATYRDAAKAEQRQVVVGSGDPVVQLPGQFCDAESARSAARAKQVEQARAEVTFNVGDMPGRSDLTAEALLILEGWRDDLGGEWLVTEVTHKLDAQGYRCEVKAERPNSDDAVTAAINAEIRDEVIKPNVVRVDRALRLLHQRV